jgi:hypothetical protein
VKHLRHYEDITYDGDIEEYEKSKEFENELHDFCESSLVYLIDEGLEIEIVERYLWTSDANRFGVKLAFHNIKLHHWDDIKDYTIPFLERLTNKYNLQKEKNNDIRIYFDRRRTNMDEMYQSKKLILDQTDRPFSLFNLIKEYRIDEIRFIVEGYKQPKKSLITKVKYFFKK